MSHYGKQRQSYLEELRKDSVQQCPGTKTVDIPKLICEMITEMNSIKEEIRIVKELVEKRYANKQ